MSVTALSSKGALSIGIKSISEMHQSDVPWNKATWSCIRHVYSVMVSEMTEFVS
jgi:hypothetical protein